MIPNLKPLRLFAVTASLLLQATNCLGFDLSQARIIDEHVRYLGDERYQKNSVIELPWGPSAKQVWLLAQTISRGRNAPDFVEEARWAQSDRLGIMLAPSATQAEIIGFLESENVDFQWNEGYPQPFVYASEPLSARSVFETLDLLSSRPDLFYFVDYSTWFTEDPVPELSPFWRQTTFEDGWRKTWMGRVSDLQMPWIVFQDLGWVYVASFRTGVPSGEVGGNEVTFFDIATNGYYTTNQSYWPYLYRFGDGHWLYYLEGSRNGSGSGWAYDVTVGEWVPW